MSNFTLDEIAPLLTREASHRRGTLLSIFAIVSLVMLMVGFTWKKQFLSYSTLYVDDSNIVRPLLENIAEASSQRDKAKVAREILFSKDIMDQILDDGGWVSPQDSAVRRAKVMREIENNTLVENINSTLIGIGFYHQTPRVAYDTTRRYADLFLAKAMKAQSVETNDAFEFIQDQVETYEGKLEDAERRLEAFRAQHPGATVGTVNVDERIMELRRDLESAQLLYAESNQRAISLERELTRESGTLQQQYQESRYLQKISEMQSQIDLLRLSYTDDYPDIVRLKQQIEEFRSFAQQERRASLNGGSTQSQFSIGGDIYSGSANLSPVYQNLRAQAADSKATAESLRSRINQTQGLLNKELGRAEVSSKVERQLSDLARDYQINKDIYEDLVKRRESARVSMSLGKEKQGVLYRIQEPANFPVLPKGMRFMHIATLGLLAGMVLPFAYLFVFLKLDPRIRTASSITEDLELPLLSVVPHMTLASEKPSWLQKRSSVIWIVLVVLVIYAIVGVIKYSQGAA